MWGSGEEINFLYRMLKKGYRGRYFYNLIVYHPLKGAEDTKRVAYYFRGMGAFFRKHLNVQPLFIIFYKSDGC